MKLLMSEQVYSFGPFILRPGRELRRDGKAVAIGQRGLVLLETMLEASGGVVSKSEIMSRVWPGLIVEDGNITVQMATLRKELGKRGDGSDWIVTIPRIGYRLDLDKEAPGAAPPADGGRPSLAVLPFINLSGDASRDYFADGIVEDLITAFSRFKTFSVVSRNSSFVYKDRAVDVRQVARELGVRYLLEGSVRLAGERVRVTVQLVDADTGTHHWATSFDGELGQIFDFQDRVTESVVGLVEPQIRRVEIERSRRRPPGNPQAYDHFLRALPAFHSGSPAEYQSALVHLDRAIEMQPDYAQALAYASWAYARGGTVALRPLSAAEGTRCLALARAALRYGGDDPMVLAICGHSLLAIGHQREEGLAATGRARLANPHNVAVLMLAGICNVLAGDVDEAEVCYRRAHQISPGAREAYESLTGIGFCYCVRREFAEAARWLERSLANLTDWPPTYWLLTASYAHLDRMDEAKSLLGRLLEFAPQTSLAGLQVIQDRSDGRLVVMMDGLAKAGLR